jgi:hypothetical protein
MKRYNHHGLAVLPEHPQGQWCRWDDVRKLRHIAQGMAYVLTDLDQTLVRDSELAQDVAKALRAWEAYDV